ncbi:MAG: hypothetical protein ACYC8V_01510 [Caulobacteraceae bacterium]
MNRRDAWGQGRRAILLVAMLAILAACAAGTPEAHHAAQAGPASSFVLGLWHGFIAPLALIIEIINGLLPGVLPWSFHLYETSAASLPYDLGFYLGLAGGPGILWSRWRRRV